MIQRIQTVFLFLTAALLVTALFFPIWQSVNPSSGEESLLTYFGYKHLLNGEVLKAKLFPFAILGILSVLSTIIALVEILMFKNRMLQMKLGMLNTLFLMANLGGCIYTVYANSAHWVLSSQNSYNVGAFLLMGAVVLNQLASRFIRRDENLVRSVDRIR